MQRRTARLISQGRHRWRAPSLTAVHARRGMVACAHDQTQDVASTSTDASGSGTSMAALIPRSRRAAVLPAADGPDSPSTGLEQQRRRQGKQQVQSPTIVVTKPLPRVLILHTGGEQQDMNSLPGSIKRYSSTDAAVRVSSCHDTCILHQQLCRFSLPLLRMIRCCVLARCRYLGNGHGGCEIAAPSPHF